MFYEEKTYNNLVPVQTKKYCTSCPPNCETCDINNDCLTCINTLYAPYNSSEKRCNCLIQNCRNCTVSDCEICIGSYLKHINSGVITCQTGPSGGCIEGYGRILGESLPATYSASCIPCTIENCKLCGTDNTVCTECYSPLAVLVATGECGELPTCRSPEKLSSVTQICGDCSEQYDSLEALELGFCSLAKSYTISIYPTENYLSKTRRFIVESDYFPINPDLTSGELEMTQEIVDRVFNVELTPSPQYYELTYKGGNMIELFFSEFQKNMNVTFSLKNATLLETYRSETDSDLLKVLIQNSHTFEIQNFTSLSESALDATESAGSTFGTASSITSKIGSLSVIISSVINLDASGSMIKALQFILLFDKLRFINFRHDNLIGTFMNAIYSAFKVNLIDVDDYEKTAKYNKNQFLSQRVQVIVYRKKMDKLIFGTLCFLLDLILLGIKRSLRIQQNTNPKKWVKLAYKYQLIDRMRYTLLTLGIVDIIFYCLHQVLHQKVSTVKFSLNLNSITFFWSFGLVFYTLASFMALYLRMMAIEKWRLTNYLSKVETEFSKKKNGGKDTTNSKEQDTKELQSPENKISCQNDESREENQIENTKTIPFKSKGKRRKFRNIASTHKKNMAKFVLFQPKSKPNFKIMKKLKEDNLKTLKRKIKKKYQRTEKIQPMKKTKSSKLLQMKKDGRMVIDTKATISNIEKGEHYIQSICANLTIESALLSSNTFNLVYLVRLVSLCIPILCLQSIPKVQIFTLLLIEGGYFSYQVYTFCKWKVPKTKFRFIINVLESFCVLNFMIYCAYSLIKTGSVSTDWYELFVMLCFLMIILLQVYQIMVSIASTIKNLIISQKLAKKNKVKTGNHQAKEDQYFNNSILVWKNSQHYEEEKVKEKNEYLRNFGPSVKTEQIQNLINNHTKTKRKFIINRNLLSKKKRVPSMNKYKRLNSILKSFSNSNSSKNVNNLLSAQKDARAQKKINFIKFSHDFSAQDQKKSISNNLLPLFRKKSNQVNSNNFNQHENKFVSVQEQSNCSISSDCSQNSPASSPRNQVLREGAIKQQISLFRGNFLNSFNNLNNSKARTIRKIISEKNERDSSKLNKSLNLGVVKNKEFLTKRNNSKIRHNQSMRVNQSFNTKIVNQDRSYKNRQKRSRKLNKIADN